MCGAGRSKPAALCFSPTLCRMFRNDEPSKRVQYHEALTQWGCVGHTDLVDAVIVPPKQYRRTIRKPPRQKTVEAKPRQEEMIEALVFAAGLTAMVIAWTPGVACGIAMAATGVGYAVTAWSCYVTDRPCVE